MPESEVEKIKKQVKKMYFNYGIDVAGMPEEDLGVVYNYYYRNKEELGEDLIQSEKFANSFSDNDIL